MANASNILETLLNPRGLVVRDLETWRAMHLSECERFERPIDRAAYEGAHSGVVALAFASGYQAALRRMFGSALPVGQLGALCVTETTGGHPKAIQTRLSLSVDGSSKLSGEKCFVTLGRSADLLFVLAVRGGTDAHKDFAVVRIARNAPGVRLSEREPLAFVPEVPHHSVWFDDAKIAAEDVLPGDGYLEYVRPFRTIEDLHVQAGLFGFALRAAADLDWPRSFRQGLLAQFETLRAIDERPASDPSTHITLGGALATSDRLFAELSEHFKDSDDPRAGAWVRDRGLLTVANTVRQKRLDAAWSRWAQREETS